MLELSQRNFTFAVAALCLLHAVVAIPMALSLNIWVDEASSLFATQQGFWTAFQTAAAEQKQAPLYFWILGVWRMLDGSIFFARLFSILGSIGAICVLSGLAKRFFSLHGAIALTAFVALHPFLFWASVEIRVYSLVVLLSVILIRLYFEIFFEPEPARYKTGLFLAFVIVSLYTNYYLGFLIAGLFLGLMVAGKWRAARKYALLMAVAGLAFVPLFVPTIAELRSRSSGALEERSLIDGGKIVWNHLLTFLLPTEIFPDEQRSIASMVRVWIVGVAGILIGFLAVVKRRSLARETIVIGTVVIAMAAAMIAAGFLVGPSLIVIRHASMMFIPVVLAFALAARDLSTGLTRTTRTVTALMSVLAVTIFFVYGVTHIYPTDAKRGDWARISAFIEQNESEHQPLIVFPAYDALVPRYHYKGKNLVLPDEKFFDFIPGGVKRSSESIRAETDLVISKIPDGAERIWLAVGELCLISDSCRPLQNYIDANYTIEIEKDFYLEKLYLLKKKVQ